jgi:hypothetical protein
MDPALLPQLCVAGALVIVVGYLLAAHHWLMTADQSDPADYLKALTAHADELASLRHRVGGQAGLRHYLESR